MTSQPLSAPTKVETTVHMEIVLAMTQRHLSIAPVRSQAFRPRKDAMKRLPFNQYQ
jgi:hypothetical protein